MLQYELKRTWRSPVPWLILIVAATVWVVALLHSGEAEPAGWQASALVQHRQLVYLLPILLMLLSAYLTWEAQRDRRTASEAIFLGWPVASWRWAMTRTLALGSVTMVSWLLLTVLEAAYAVYSYAGVASLAGDLGVGPLLRDIGIMAADLMASLLAVQVTAQVVAAVVPGIGGLVLVILYRIFALLGPGLVVQTFQWPYFMLVGPELAVWWPHAWQPISEAFGLAPYETLFWTHRAFWIGGSLAALACLVFLYRNRRDQPAVRSPLWAGTAVVAAVLCAIPLVAYGKKLTDAFATVVSQYGEKVKPQLEVDAEGHVRNRRPSPETSARPDDPVPVRYEIHADLTDGPEGRFRVQLDVELKEAASEIPLTLRRVFQVESVTVDGQPVLTDEVVRSGDLLRIPLGEERGPGDQVRLALTYRGRIEDWRISDRPEVSAIARKGMLLVPATWGWYPVPGEFTLTYEIPLTSMVYRAIVDRERAFGEAAPHFDVTLHAPPGVRSVAGFVPVDEPVAAGSRWRLEGARQQVSLVGGDWWSFERDGITYLVPREYLDTWEEASADLHALLQIMRDWAGPERLTVTPITTSEPKVIDLEMMEAGYFGPVYQVSPDRAYLVQRLQGWMFHNEVLTRADRPADEAEQDSASATEQYGAIQYYVVQRIREAYLGQTVDLEDRDPSDPVGRWISTTSLEEQKRQFRELFAAARTRPMTMADLAFLGEGDGP